MNRVTHYSGVITSAMASQIAGVLNVYSTVCSGTDRRKHQSSVSLDFVREILRWPVNSLHNGPVARKIFPFDDVIMYAMWVNICLQVSTSKTKMCCADCHQDVQHWKLPVHYYEDCWSDRIRHQLHWRICILGTLTFFLWLHRKHEGCHGASITDDIVVTVTTFVF